MLVCIYKTIYSLPPTQNFTLDHFKQKVILYKENIMFCPFWIDFFSFQNYPQLLIQITHIINR